MPSSAFPLTYEEKLDKIIGQALQQFAFSEAEKEKARALLAAWWAADHPGTAPTAVDDLLVYRPAVFLASSAEGQVTAKMAKEIPWASVPWPTLLTVFGSEKFGWFDFLAGADLINQELLDRVQINTVKHAPKATIRQLADQWDVPAFRANAFQSLHFWRLLSKIQWSLFPDGLFDKSTRPANAGEMLDQIKKAYPKQQGTILADFKKANEFQVKQSEEEKKLSEHPPTSEGDSSSLLTLLSGGCPAGQVRWNGDCLSASLPVGGGCPSGMVSQSLGGYTICLTDTASSGGGDNSGIPANWMSQIPGFGGPGPFLVGILANGFPGISGIPVPSTPAQNGGCSQGLFFQGNCIPNPCQAGFAPTVQGASILCGQGGSGSSPTRRCPDGAIEVGNSCDCKPLGDSFVYDVKENTCNSCGINAFYNQKTKQCNCYAGFVVDPSSPSGSGCVPAGQTQGGGEEPKGKSWSTGELVVGGGVLATLGFALAKLFGGKSR